MATSKKWKTSLYFMLMLAGLFLPLYLPDRKRRLDPGGSVPDMALPPPDSESNRQAEKPLAVGNPQRADHTGDSAGCPHVLLPVFLSGSEKPAAESA